MTQRMAGRIHYMSHMKPIRHRRIALVVSELIKNNYLQAKRRYLSLRTCYRRENCNMMRCVCR